MAERTAGARTVEESIVSRVEMKPVLGSFASDRVLIEEAIEGDHWTISAGDERFSVETAVEALAAVKAIAQVLADTRNISSCLFIEWAPQTKIGTQIVQIITKEA